MRYFAFFSQTGFRSLLQMQEFSTSLLFSALNPDSSPLNVTIPRSLSRLKSFTASLYKPWLDFRGRVNWKWPNVSWSGFLSLVVLVRTVSKEFVISRLETLFEGRCSLCLLVSPLVLWARLGGEGDMMSQQKPSPPLGRLQVLTAASARLSNWPIHWDLNWQTQAAWQKVCWWSNTTTSTKRGNMLTSTDAL